MARDTHVDPPALTRSGRHVSDVHAHTHRVLSQAHAQIQDAIAGGWIGDSADAMRVRVASMRAAAAAVTARLEQHSEHFYSSANLYASTDQDAAQKIKAEAAPNGGRTSLNLDR